MTKGSVRRLEVKSLFELEALAEQGNDFLAFVKHARTSQFQSLIYGNGFTYHNSTPSTVVNV